VVDTRFNTGGDLVDDLSIFLSGHAYMKFPTRTPERIVGTETAARWTRPSIVIASEANYSDGHCFPWAYQKLGIGKVVGTPISGTCTFVLGERLSPEGLLLRIPFLPVTDAAGQVLERQELQPDVQVEALPQDLAAGVDRQLERAVAELLAQIGE
jgi:C-terminal processing protease CtpA/Prc